MRVLLILLAGQPMATMDGSILAVAAPSLQQSLRASDAELQKVDSDYSVENSVAIYKNNIMDVINDGYVAKADLCKDAYAALCTSAGIA